MALRWGIIGIGKISHDFVTALATIVDESGERLHKVVAVASSSAERARDFAVRHGVAPERALDSYSALVQLSDVDAVYIGSIHPNHPEHSRLALAQGKAVLCEKPMTVNAKETRELCAYAKSKGAFLMEALWSRFLPSYRYMLEVLESGVIGEARVVQVTFGFNPPEQVDRLVKKDMGGGALLDIGCYVLNVALMAFGDEKPEKITASGLKYDSGVDHTAAMTLLFSGGRFANLSISVRTAMPNEAFVLGSKGWIKLTAPFWSTTRVEVSDGTTKDFPLPEASHPFNFPNSCGLRFEAEEVRKCLAEGLKESRIMSHEASVLFRDIMDEARRQIGVVMPQDE